MIETTAQVPTTNADKYVLRLCKQWAHRIEVNFQERQGVIHFENAIATLTPSSDELVVTILAADNPTVERIQGVVASHLDRFAHREAPLQFDWHRSDRLALGAL